MNSTDWVAATGSYMAGRGGYRPMRESRHVAKAAPKASSNSRLLREVAVLIAQARTPTAAAPALALTRKARRRALAVAITGERRAAVAEARQRRDTLITCSAAYWRSTRAEQLRTLLVLQRFHGPR